MKILVTPTSLQPGKNDQALDMLKKFSSDLVFNPKGKPLTEDELLPLLKDCDGYIAGLDHITDRVMANCPHLKVISRYGAGYDRVDIQAAGKRKIAVTNTPGVNAEAVGELAFGLILASARKIPYLDAQTRKGAWIRSTGMELQGKTLGIMGLGAIGRVVARCAQGFNMQVIAYDPYIDASYCRQHKINTASFKEVLENSQVISLHLPLTEDTRHLIDAQAISAMQDGMILVNASRGGILDEAAVYEALVSGRIGGLGLDAFEVEPPVGSQLLELPSVIATPHTGAHTKEATDNMAYVAIKNLIDVLSGNACKYLVK